MKRTPFQPDSTFPRRGGGAVIIVVLSLMTTLVFLGLFFYNWTGQERANAENFGNAQPLELDPDPIFDSMLEQLVVGTRAGRENSALWGGMHSMLAHQIGRIGPDLVPFDFGVRSGQGIRIEFEDADNDGYPDNEDDYFFVYRDLAGNEVRRSMTDPNSRFVMNFCRLAQTDQNQDAFHTAQGANQLPVFQPDVDYTYPDINAPFLAYEEWMSINSLGTDRRLVLIPSFFRPQYFPQLRSSDGTDLAGANGYSQIYSDPIPANLAAWARTVLRPHPMHVYPGAGPLAQRQRFLSQQTVAMSGDRTRILNGFPFPTGAMGVFSNASSEAASVNYSLLDVDLDGDGIKDAIWLDLDLPLIDLRGGRQVVPLASFKVLDADGLLNLNVHGNLEPYVNELRNGAPADDATLSALLTPPVQPLSVSNLGMSRSEVNPIWALRGDVGSLSAAEQNAALADIQSVYGTVATDVMTIANLEYFHLVRGRRASSHGGVVAGRWGDEDLLSAVDRSPLPGQASDFASGTLHDDDLDDDIGGFGQPANDLSLGLPVPGFVHPLPPTGLGLEGAYVVDPTAGATRILGGLPNAGPGRWLQYDEWQQLHAASAVFTPVYPQQLQTAGTQLIDENDEMVVEPGARGFRQFDRPFEPRESVALQLSNADLSQLGIASRALDLAGINFRHVRDSDLIRSQFTADSWNRLDFNYTPLRSRFWEWEPTGEFPPDFPHDGGVNTVDPFREELRELLRTVYPQIPAIPAIGPSRLIYRHRLLLDRVLSNDFPTGGDAAFVDGNPRFRNLIPHPPELTGSDVNSYMANPMYHGDGTPPVPFSEISSDVYAQEWWARYDRQRLARDIYVLLYTLAWGVDGIDISSVNPYSPEQAREMAQFAVNVVDAMDRDNVITCFEYDPDLSNGWSSVDPSLLQRVYGIEQQELAFNEVLLIRTEEGTDSANTEFDEENDPVFHSFVELRNAAPWNVPIDNRMWRLRRVEPETFVATFVDTQKIQLAPGEEFLIGCQDGYNAVTPADPSTRRPSDFRVDHDQNGSFDLIVPNYAEDPTSIPTTGTSLATYPGPFVDLDLMHPSHAGRVVESYDVLTSLLNHTTGLPAGSPVYLTLERRLRADPNQELTDAANPWIEVDRVEAVIRGWDPELPNQPEGLQRLRSQERREPLQPGAGPNAGLPDDYGGGADPIAGLHTLPFNVRPATVPDNANGERRNSQTPTAAAGFALWQPHFDRDFASVAELLSIPLYGWGELTPLADWKRLDHGGPTKNVAEAPASLQLSNRTAGMRFRFSQDRADLPSWIPQAILDPDSLATTGHYANRWYRLLEFVSVRSQEDHHAFNADDAVSLTFHRRTPGQLNLNTIRHEAALKGLIDDRFHFDPASPGLWPTSDSLESDRDWYGEFRLARDGLDSILGPAAAPGERPITIPGGLYSRPFRSLSHVSENSYALDVQAAADRSAEHTILRHRFDPADPTLFNEKHGLFEARTFNDVGTDAVDYHSRDRILGKVMNNSTTRSNVFFVWVGIDFFDAHRNANGLVQIGAQAADLPSYRLFCVVDMSRLEEAYDPSTNTFDFRKFLLHRQLLP